MGFVDWVTQHWLKEAEDEEKQGDELPSLCEAVELVLEVEKHWLSVENKEAKEKIPEVFSNALLWGAVQTDGHTWLIVFFPLPSSFSSSSAPWH